VESQVEEHRPEISASEKLQKTQEQMEKDRERQGLELSRNTCWQIWKLQLTRITAKHSKPLSRTSKQKLNL